MPKRAKGPSRAQLLALRDACEAPLGHFTKERYPSLSDAQRIQANRLYFAKESTRPLTNDTLAYRQRLRGILSAIKRGSVGNPQVGWSMLAYRGVAGRKRKAVLQATT